MSDSQDVFPICRICLDNCRDGGMGGESLCIRRDSKRLMGTFLEIPSRSSHSTNVHIITIIVLRVYFRIVQHMDVFTPLYDLDYHNTLQRRLHLYFEQLTLVASRMLNLGCDKTKVREGCC